MRSRDSGSGWIEGLLFVEYSLLVKLGPLGRVVDAAYVQHGLSSWQTPTHAAAFHSVFDHITAGSFDHARGDGVPGPRGPKWWPNTIRHILGNQNYVGTYIFGKRTAAKFYKVTADGIQERSKADVLYKPDSH